MANLKRSLVTVLVALALLSVLTVFCQAVMTSLTVKGGEELNHTLNLVLEDRVSIQYRVVGGNANAMQFSMTFPNGTVKDFGGLSTFSYSFVCDAEGDHILNFVNTDQADVLLTLEYEVQHYIYGMPQMLFMVILIAVVSVAGVAVFIGLSRKPY
jgi:hypothetical protein